MSNIEQLKATAREKAYTPWDYKNDTEGTQAVVNIEELDEIVTSTYLQAVEAIEPIIRRHYKNGCDDKYRDECMEMILEKLQSLIQTKEQD